MKVKVFEGTSREIEGVLNEWLQKSKSEFELFHIGQTQCGDKIMISIFYRKAE